MTLDNLLNTSQPILTEAAIVERLKHEHHLPVDPDINHAGLIYDEPVILGNLYRQYIDIAQRYKLPIMLMTPTRRVNFESMERSAYSGRNVIQDSGDFLKKIRAGYKEPGAPILLGGLLGCKGDAYSLEGGLSRKDAYLFHREQVKAFSNQNLDFLFSGIMPAAEEAAGMALAMEECGLPYIISFTIRNTGCLLDKTPISEAIERIDSAVDRKPLCYMANCVHPLNVIQALEQEVNADSPHMARLKGIQANSSQLSPEKLDQSCDLHGGDFGDLVRHMLTLQRDFGFKILGGCCGTDDIFLEMLAQALI